MKQKRILVVDDEQDLCDILLFNLKVSGYDAKAAYSAEEALKHLAWADLLLLDVMMPGISGFEMAEQMKVDPKTARIPIIFLTAKDTEHDTLQGFGLGADDYITKPFSIREVMARVKAVLNRSQPLSNATDDILEYMGLTIDHATKNASIDGEAITLTKTEFELLDLLIRHRGQLFTRQQLLELVWPKDVIVSDRTVDVNITRLRKKLGNYASCIVARHGYGYYFIDYERK